MSVDLQFFDGAFGTYYVQRTQDSGPCEAANLQHPHQVLAIHREYIAAGVDAIKTNTFNANLTVYPDYRKVREIVTAGYELAGQAAQGTKVRVFADIGAIDSQDVKEAALQYTAIAEMFLRLGATCFLFETLYEYEPILPAVARIKKTLPEATVMVSFAVSQDGYTRGGNFYKTLLQRAAENANIDIVGLNCVCGPAYLLKLVKDLAPLPKPLAVMPNSGYPSSENGRTIFRDNAEYFAEKLQEIHAQGVSIVGGCCGTTPKHIALAIQSIQGEENAGGRAKQTVPATGEVWGDKLPWKPLAVELDPPADGDCTFVLSAARKLKQRGVRLITLADAPLAKARADSIMTAAKIKREIGLDVLPHLTCRDRNHLAVKGSLLGARFEQIDKILVVTGDALSKDMHLKREGVFHFHSVQLIEYIKSMNQELFSDTPFTVGGALNINAVNFEAELTRCQRKIQSGAAFLFSQPLFTQNAVNNFIKAKKALSCKLFAGILPVASYKNAVFLNNEVSGIEIPPEILAQMRDQPPATVYEISIALCRDLIRSVYDYADGFYIMTPLQKVDLVCALVERCFMRKTEEAAVF